MIISISTGTVFLPLPDSPIAAPELSYAVNSFNPAKLPVLKVLSLMYFSSGDNRSLSLHIQPLPSYRLFFWPRKTRYYSPNPTQAKLIPNKLLPFFGRIIRRWSCTVLTTNQSRRPVTGSQFGFHREHERRSRDLGSAIRGDPFGPVQFCSSPWTFRSLSARSHVAEAAYIQVSLESKTADPQLFPVASHHRPLRYCGSESTKAQAMTAYRGSFWANSFGTS